MTLLEEYLRWVDPVPVEHKVTGPIPKAIWLTGDQHVGAKTCDFIKLQLHLALAKKEKAAVVLLGDPIECVTTSSKVGQSGAWMEQFLPKKGHPLNAQVEMFCDLFKGMRVLGSVAGNHEARLAKQGFDLNAVIAERLGAEDWGALASVRIGKGRLFVHHGEGAGAQYFRKQMVSFPNHDIWAAGHTHELTVRPVLQDNKTRYQIRTGSYLRFAAYAAVKAYEPQPTGSVLVYLDTDGRPESVRILT